MNVPYRILMLLSNQGEGGKWVKWEFEIFKFNSAHNFSTMLRNEIIYLVVVNITLSILQLQTTKPSYGVGDKLFKPVHTSYLHFFELLPLYFRLFIFMHTYFNNFYNWHICTLFLVFYFILIFPFLKNLRVRVTIIMILNNCVNFLKFGIYAHFYSSSLFWKILEWESRLSGF